MKKLALLTLLLFAFGMIFSIPAYAQQQRDTSKQQAQQQSKQEQQQPKQQQQQSRDQVSTKGNLARGEELKGMTVRNTQGQDLGTIQDAIVSTQTGKVEYVVIQSGGTAGIGGKMIPVPINAFQLTKDKRLVLNITPDKLQSAPTLSKEQWPPANETRWSQDVHSYFSKQTAQTQKSESQPTPMGKR